MKRFVFLAGLRAYLESKRTAKCAAARIRSVLANDRDLVQVGVTKKLSAELTEVLARYFTVTDFCFRMEAGEHTECVHYTLEADLVKT